MHTARVFNVNRDPETGTLLIRARCENCRKVVMHGGGNDLDDLQLGNRVAHCGCCDSYDLVDGHGVVRTRLRVIRAEAAGQLTAREQAERRRVHRAERRAERRAARLATSRSAL